MHCIPERSLATSPPPRLAHDPWLSSGSHSPSASPSGEHLRNHDLFAPADAHSPSLGAYFASRPVPMMSAPRGREMWNIYAVPAAISIGLLLAETAYLAAVLPETRGWQRSSEEKPSTEGQSGSSVKTSESIETRLARLSAIGQTHGLFLLFFSGVSRPHSGYGRDR